MKDLDQEQYKVEKWNGQFQIGQDVVLKEDFKVMGTLTTTRSDAQIMCGGAVIWLEGVTGCYNLGCVIPIEYPKEVTPVKKA